MAVPTAYDDAGAHGLGLPEDDTLEDTLAGSFQYTDDTAPKYWAQSLARDRSSFFLSAVSAPISVILSLVSLSRAVQQLHKNV